MTDKEIEAGIERACECDCAPPSTGWTVNPFPIIHDYIERLKHRAEVAEKECDEWKERAERMHKEALKQKQRVSESKYSEDALRNQIECAMDMVSEMEHAKRTLKILYMSGAITEEAFRDAVKQAKLEIEEENDDDR